MRLIEWAQFILGTGLLFVGLAIFVVELIGVFKFQYILNRMHAAAMGDTLGLAAAIIGLIIMNGMNFTSVKLFLVVVFLWCASPVSSHLIAQLEATTNPEAGEYESKTLAALEAEEKEEK